MRPPTCGDADDVFYDAKRPNWLNASSPEVVSDRAAPDGRRHAWRWAIPKGPRREERPADVVARAVKVMRIATGEEEEDTPKESAAAEMGRKGGKARAEKMTPEQRAEIAKKAAAKRWAK